MTLLNENYLLQSKPAQTLFHDYAEKMPIIDFHCHLNPNEIYENKNFKNMTRVWLNDGLYGDHYKWRLMRANGVPEELITGDGDDYQKFLAWSATIEKAVGNPLYEWTHLELKRIFGIETIFNRQSAPEIWAKGNALLATDDFKPRALIRRFNVKALCTTDDPASDLHYHQLLAKTAAEDGFKTLPALRPDAVMKLEDDGYGAYLKKLGKAAGVEIKNFATLAKALHQRFDYFNQMGGRLSDHSLENWHFVPADRATVDAIIQKAIANQPISAVERDQYLTKLLAQLMRLNHEFGWTMQFHMNANRNLNRGMYAKIGPDTGYDAMGSQPDMVQQIQALYQTMQEEHQVPQSIFYSLNPNDWLPLATVMGSFQEGSRQKLQLGAGWWFNDTVDGMNRQLATMANQSLLPNFVGMLTDSRSFLSYPRHEYFRRVLCNFFGNLVEEGRAPEDMAFLGKIVQDISYNNAHDYFGFFN